MSNELVESLIEIEQYLIATIGLDSGRLVQTETHLYFIIERFGNWEIIEECSLDSIQKIESVESFIGSSTVIYTNSSSWTCKDLPKEINLEQWLNASSGSDSDLMSSGTESGTLELEETHSSTHLIETSDIEKENRGTAVEERPPENVDSVNETTPNPDVIMIRKIIQNRSDLKEKIQEKYGLGRDVLGDEVLLDLVEQNPALVQLLRKMGGGGDEDSLNTEVSPEVRATYKQIVNGENSPIRKLAKVVIYFFVAILILQFLGVGCFVVIALLSGS